MSDELFAAAPKAAAGALADRMRPRTLDEFIGQDHIVGPGRLLRRAIQRDRLSSIILSGPPGTGKTTLARVIANTTSSRFISINAVLSGIQAIRDATESARRERELYDRKTILFVDEVHRWNKAQQDALLPFVENGTVVLVGATTENPYFEVNKALVSRSRVFQLEALSDGDLMAAAMAAIADAERGYGAWKVSFAEGALEHLVKTAAGDARSLLNALELAVETSADSWPPPPGAAVLVTMAAAEESIQRRAVLYDSDGDYHYDASSALIKSVRGSDPDAAVYWMARMVYAGEDPRFIFRRLLISAAEDVGLADPRAVGVVESCAASYDRIGLPEGQFHLAEAVLYLATAPKSNSALSYFDALEAVESERADVPDHLKDANRDAEGLGHGAGYLYPHAYRDHWTAQQYLPSTLKGAVFYQPGALGYEASVRDEVLRRRDAQLAAWLGSSRSRGQTKAPTTHAEASSWTDRAEAGAAAGLAALRAAMFAAAAVSRHHNVLVLSADDGLLLREAVRLCPDGSVTGLCADQRGLERLSYAFADVEDILKPNLALRDGVRSAAETAAAAAGHGNFDIVMAAGLLSSDAERSALASCAAAFPGARFVLAERASIPGILPAIVAPRLEKGLAEDFGEADAAFYASDEAPGLDAVSLSLAARNAGLVQAESSACRSEGRRALSDRDVDAWLSADSPYGSRVRARLGGEGTAAVSEALKAAAAGGAVSWPNAWTVAVCVAACPPPAPSL